MATTFLEPGGDADFNATTTNGFWGLGTNAVVATDFVHGGHIKSIKHGPSTSGVARATGVLADTGRRISFYMYINVLPGATSTFCDTNSGPFRLRITTGGVLQIWETAVQIGTNGSTLSTGIWYRICLAYTITSTTINRFELFVDGVSSISITNATLSSTGSSSFRWLNAASDSSFDFRTSDHYVDDSSTLTDTGDIWVTAKRPNANGTTNGFTTQIGVGGSGYGSGHSPQVNERPLSTTNGWSIVEVAATTEEYNIEGAATGDIDISAATIIDYLGWVSVNVTAGTETSQIVVNGAASNISVTASATVFTKIAGSPTYPAGTGTDIGIISANAGKTIKLYECGIIVAYTPGSPPPPSGFATHLLLSGVGKF